MALWCRSIVSLRGSLQQTGLMIGVALTIGDGQRLTTLVEYPLVSVTAAAELPTVEIIF